MRVLFYLMVLACMLPLHASAQLFSPGPLSRFHIEQEGDDRCNDCHSNGRRVRDQLCLDCHTDLNRRVRARAGLHGDEYRGQACSPCHVEHLGRNVPQIRWPGGDKNAFDHDLAGWPLNGAHTTPECSDCHNHGRSFLHLETACVSCHDDVHERRFDRQCETCHNERTWDLPPSELQTFDHALARFPLRGAHAQVECNECHHDPPQWDGLQFRRCTDCHEDPHESRLGNDCTSCHNETDWIDVPRSEHPGLIITRGHNSVACERCHDQGNLEAPSRGSRCVACHRPVHEAPFGRRCERCHAGIHWLNLPRRIGLNAHTQTPFSLNGAHRDVACTSCHDPSLSANARFRELEFSQCGSCHEDPHVFAFAGADGFDCAACHGEDAFAPSDFTVEHHAQTSWPLTGQHANTACTGCHGSDRPRTSFRVQEQTCVSCHDNPHGDQFADEMRQGGCGECHGTSSWDRPTINHDTWPLTGAHEVAACESCHSPTAADRATGTGASYRGVERECDGCHQDDHAGQFRLSDPVRPCEDCHGTDSFVVDAFDHEAHTEYPLTGLHEDVDCAACHPTETLPNGEAVVRYRLGYDECVDCHANPHEEDRRPAPGRPAPRRAHHVPLAPPSSSSDGPDERLLAWIRATPASSEARP